MKANIFLTGFSGTGKSTVGRDTARRLGWRYVDTDTEIVRAAGKSIHAIFRDDSEARFRELERHSLAEACRGESQVVSTGGGIVTDEANRQLMEASGLIVCLEARPETIHDRLAAQDRDSGNTEVRPLLGGGLDRIRSLKSQRQQSYALAHWTVHTDALTPKEAADQVVEAWETMSRRQEVQDVDGDLVATVRTASGNYPVWVGWGILRELPERVRRVGTPGAAYVITDRGAYRHGRNAQIALEGGGIPAHIFTLPSGETSKTLEMANTLYGWLARLKAERGHMVLAVGGGVVGDVAGFVAATFLRGLAFAQVPTTMLAMMDASIGGKTAVDLPQGKNLVGAFYQPRLVLSDVETLRSLPDRELRSGWAEAVKHGLIMDEGLLRRFEEEREPILGLDPSVAADVIRRSVAIKADVVSRDERETLGLRVLLNYGHTIGHAIEAATGYSRFLHGEAVSLGMTAAAHISLGMGTLTGAEVERQRTLLKSYGLPVSASGLDREAIYDAVSMDKKTTAGSVRWVLLDGIGRAVTHADVPPGLVNDALDVVLSGNGGP